MTQQAAARDSSPGPLVPLAARSAAAIARPRLRSLPKRDRDAFLDRLKQYWPDLMESWANVYGSHPGGQRLLRGLVEVMADRFVERSPSLKALDVERAAQPDWFQDPSMIGYVAYPARFGGTLSAVGQHVDYLAGLHVRYLHLMPLLRSRPGAADGGYAVADYREVEPSLGTMDDLEALCGDLRARGMSLCIDLVLNHTAAEHPWAMAAASGDPDAAAMYRIYPDRTEPDRWELTLPWTFPETAPGNFTRLPDGRWVWTTFNDYQWDLDWSNPTVFVEMADVLLTLAARGVEVFRLDAVAFLWKRLGTDCQNLPEVHDILQALRACARITAPAVIFKAEAIVAPHELIRYLGVGRHRGRVSDLAYHNTLMVQFWSAVATRDARLATRVLHDLPRKPATTAWATYIRCHDDIGWAVMDEDAAAVGWEGRAHRAFLSEFYAGRFPGSFARGDVFQFVPSTGDSRISGTFASLAGLEAATDAEDPVLIDVAIERIRLGHALMMAWDGVPLIYMGDEIGLLNDWSYRTDPDRARDNRWLHRPVMDWASAARRTTPGSIEARIFMDLRLLIEARRETRQFHAGTPLDVVDLGDAAIFAFVRRHADGDLLAIYNFADDARAIASGSMPPWRGATVVDRLDASVHPAREPIEIGPRGVRWLTDAADRAVVA
ncbi:MAG: amylosucrase [Chloroflexota bacterium]